MKPISAAPRNEGVLGFIQGCASRTSTLSTTLQPSTFLAGIATRRGEPTSVHRAAVVPTPSSRFVSPISDGTDARCDRAIADAAYAVRKQRIACAGIAAERRSLRGAGEERANASDGRLSISHDGATAPARRSSAETTLFLEARDLRAPEHNRRPCPHPESDAGQKRRASAELSIARVERAHSDRARFASRRVWQAPSSNCLC